jgi:hypothetical protein
MIARHGGCRFTASAGRSTDAPGCAASRGLDTGNEHMFRQLIASVFIHGFVDGKPVISFFQQ